MKYLLVLFFVLFFSLTVFSYSWGCNVSAPSDCLVSSGTCQSPYFCSSISPNDCFPPLVLDTCSDTNGNRSFDCSYDCTYCFDDFGNQVDSTYCSCLTGDYIPGTPQTSNNCCSVTDGSDPRYSYDGEICCNTTGLSKPVACTQGGISVCCPTNSECGVKKVNGHDAPACLVGGGGGASPPFYCLDISGNNIPCGFTQGQCNDNLLCADNSVGAGCTNNSDCGTGNICVNGECTVGGGPGSECSSNTDCADGSVCSADGVCVADPICVPSTDCGTQTCGNASDGCGGVIPCGECATDKACDATGTCIDDPNNICDSGICGTIYDFDSGFINCGGCGFGQDCNSNSCVPTNTPCTPDCAVGEICTNGVCKKECQPNQCGFNSDGALGVNYCGGCGNSEVCSGNVCVPVCDPATNPDCLEVCTPQTCNQLGAECGNISDTCSNLIDCGGCSDGETCSNNLCIPIETCTPKTVCASNDCGLVSNNCNGSLDCSANCPPGTINTIIDLSGTFKTNLILQTKCKINDPSSTVKVYLDGSLINTFNSKSCLALGNTIDLGSEINVLDNSIVQVTLNINEPCSVCSKTVYVPFVKQNESVIPDNNIFAVLLILVSVVFIFFKKIK